MASTPTPSPDGGAVDRLLAASLEPPREAHELFAGWTWARSLAVLAAALALVWAAAWGVAAWSAHTRGEDAAASYTPLELTRRAPPPDPSIERFALRGKLLWERSVERRGKGGRTQFVPIVANGWAEGDPVRFVAELDIVDAGIQERAARSGRVPAVFRVKPAGDLPSNAIPIFAESKVPVDGDTRLVNIVAEPRAGLDAGEQAAAEDTARRQDVVMWGTIGSIAVLLVALTLFLLVKRTASLARRGLRR